ncbi:MAG: hypothetical protein H6Q00_338 [Holophagaceae bacterium]|nr:hypothetical protein [Holophagaceae bacterium]
MEVLTDFILAASSVVRHTSNKQRAEALLERWGTAWQGPQRALDATYSNHGAYLHFNQLIGKVWSHAFTFHASQREGLVLRGPDTDRARKSHKHRDSRLDATGLDALFLAWSAHPEAHPAGNAVEFYLEETPDETWETCLQEALKML